MAHRLLTTASPQAARTLDNVNTWRLTEISFRFPRSGLGDTEIRCRVEVANGGTYDDAQSFPVRLTTAGLATMLASACTTSSLLQNLLDKVYDYLQDEGVLPGSGTVGNEA